MKPIYPVNTQYVASALIERAEATEEFVDAQHTHFFDLEFIYNIDGFPEEFCIFLVENERYYSILSHQLIEELGEGLGTNHFPICWPGKIFKIIGADGDDITSLYFSNKDRLLLSSVEVDLFRKSPLMLVRGHVCLSAPPGLRTYDSLTMCRETIVDADEAVLFKSYSPEPVVYFTTEGFVIKDPVLPDLVVEYGVEQSRIYYDTPYSKKLYCFLDRIETTPSKAFFNMPVLSLSVSEAVLEDSNGTTRELQEDQLIAAQLLDTPPTEAIENLREKLCLEFYRRRKAQLRVS